MSDSGTVQLEIDQLKLCIVGASEETRIRVDFELQSQEKYLMWSTGSAVRSTPEVSAFIERTETHENESDSEPNTTEKKGDMCIFGFNDFRFVRSNYVEFTSTNLASVSNTNIFIRVVSLPSEKDAKIAAAAAAASAAAAPAKGGKGAPTPAAVAIPTEVAEKILVQAIFPLSKIFIEKTFAVMCDFNDGSLEIQSSDSSVTLGDSSIALRLSFDNELAEFAYGGAFLRFSDLVVRNAPEGFILRCDDVIDPKAKVPPSETELRAKYLENIIKLATSPEAAATFSLSFSGIEQLIPPMILVASAITFDSETAMTVPPEQNIRQSTHLWTYRFSDTPLVFLHKSQVRRLLALSRAELVLHGEMKKERAADGAPVSASFSLDVSALRSPDIISFPLEVPLMTVTSEEDGQGAVESENGGFLLATLGISRPLSTSVENVGVSASSGDMKVNGRSAVGHSAIADPKRDVLREFRAEVDAVVRQIAIEYVQMFPSTSTATPSLPQPPNSVGMAGGSSNNSVDISMDEGAKRSREYEDRRTTFLYEMSIRGIYHELKERLKPRIQRLVRYELRSGGSLTGKKPLGIENSPDALARQAHILLTDIYTILVQECTRVLNSIFSSTVVKFEELEFDSPSEMGGLAALDDEVERDRQRFNRLQALATDCSADSRRAAAEQVHLERVQLANRGQGMSSDPSMVHSAYTEYAMYMLGMRKFVSQNNSFLLERAKEVLELAFMATSSVLSSTQLLVSICVELGDLNRAETLLCNVLQGQLSNKGLDNLSNLDGYETDEIVSSVDYLSYIILAVLRLRQGSPIAARRAIRLAVRALEHEIDRGEYSIDLGRPKRGAVVCLGRAALYFFERGMPSIAQTCYSLASDSDSATSKKAMARSMPADTPPVIRYILKSAESFAHLHAGRVDEAIFASEESANVTNDRQLEAKGWVHNADILLTMPSKSNSIIDPLLKAYSCEVILPLSAYVSLCRVLLRSGRFEKALEVSLKGFQNYSTSATLLLLVGTSCLRLNRLTEAESALAEATLLDSRNAEIWMVLSLLCLSHGSVRLDEATKALQQAARIASDGYNNPALLRELATSFISVDKLQIAEDLIRQAMACESATVETGKPSAYTRKMLADVLAGQNQTAKSIEEYKIIMGDDDADFQTKIDAGKKTVENLSTLGWTEERDTVLDALTSLEQVNSGSIQ